jgi:hypothetical protein
MPPIIGGRHDRPARIAMYIVAIGWIYVTFLMALTETSFVAGAATFLFYGLLPLSVFVYVFGTPWRRARRRRAAASVAVPGDEAHQPDRADAKPDQ